MCGRYALGAAHLNFLHGLQGQYARLFGNRGPNLDEEDDSPGPLRLRGGGTGGEAVEGECDCHIKWEREQDFWSRWVSVLPLPYHFHYQYHYLAIAIAIALTVALTSTMALTLTIALTIVRGRAEEA